MRRLLPLGACGALLLAACSDNAPSALDTHAPQAHRIADIWWLMLVLAVVVYVVVAGFILVALVRGRRTETGKPAKFSDNRFIVVGGILVPAIILGVLAVETVRATADLRESPPGALHIEVVGKQWWWEVRYPGTGVVTANEIRVPVGRPVEIGMTSTDVNHSLWVPELNGKVDLIPGEHTVTRFTAQRAGTYRGQCAEFCGIQHAKMAFLVVADDDFDGWLARHRQPPPAPASSLAATGRRVFTREACAGCHTIRGTSARGTLGPDLTDFGGRRTLGAVSVRNNRGNLAGWIVNAQSIKPGNLMPPISLEPDELQALLAYLESLK